MIHEATTSSKIVFNFFTVGISSTMAYIGLDIEVFALFTILLVIDYITGIVKARTLRHSITSNKMKYGMLSKISLLIVPITLAIGAKAVGADFKSILEASMYVLILSEVYSILGNVYSIRSGEELPEYDAVASIGKKIKSILIRAENV